MSYEADRAMCEGAGQLTDEEDALCAALGIDPAEVNGVQIVVEPGRGAYAVWTSRRKVDLARVAAAIDTPEPRIPDPWAGQLNDEPPIG